MGTMPWLWNFTIAKWVFSEFFFFFLCFPSIPSTVLMNNSINVTISTLKPKLQKCPCEVEGFLNSLINDIIQVKYIIEIYNNLENSNNQIWHEIIKLKFIEHEKEERRKCITSWHFWYHHACIYHRCAFCIIVVLRHNFVTFEIHCFSFDANAVLAFS